MKQFKIISVPFQANKRVWYVVQNGSFIGGPFTRRDEAVLFIRNR